MNANSFATKLSGVVNEKNIKFETLVVVTVNIIFSSFSNMIGLEMLWAGSNKTSERTIFKSGNFSKIESL